MTRELGQPYQPGDKVEGSEMTVDTNHFGLPWPVTIDGRSLMGVVSARRIPMSQPVLLDAMTGQPLSEHEIAARMDNDAFDYGMRLHNNTGRRHPVPHSASQA